MKNISLNFYWDLKTFNSKRLKNRYNNSVSRSHTFFVFNNNKNGSAISVTLFPFKSNKFQKIKTTAANKIKLNLKNKFDDRNRMKISSKCHWIIRCIIWRKISQQNHDEANLFIFLSLSFAIFRVTTSTRSSSSICVWICAVEQMEIELQDWWWVESEFDKIKMRKTAAMQGRGEIKFKISVTVKKLKINSQLLPRVIEQP